MTLPHLSRGEGPRVAIIGGSMAGLFAAISLRARGYSVRVYERAKEELANRGAGIATHHGLHSALSDAGIEVRADMGVASTGRVLFEASGAVAGELDAPQLMTSWGLIYRLLRHQCDEGTYHGGFELRDVARRGETLRARFANGEEVECDYLIGADGARSTVRQLVAPQATLDYCGYFAWRGLLRENLLEPEVLPAFGERMALNMAPGGHWLGYLVAGPDDETTRGSRHYNWAWYRTADENLYREHLTDETGRFFAHGIPHHLVRTKLIDVLHEQAHAQLAPVIQSVIDSTEHPFLQGIYDVGCERLIHDRVILIGDAAFTARPHVGLGVAKAALDATSLARAFGDAAKMEAWERERLAYGSAALAWSRDLGSHCGPAPTTDAGRAKAGQSQAPEVLLTETAATEPGRFLARYSRTA
ncbi:MAG: FAD-dependent monooxygenase [Myxococcota bacterium]